MLRLIRRKWIGVLLSQPERCKLLQSDEYKQLDLNDVQLKVDDPMKTKVNPMKRRKMIMGTMSQQKAQEANGISLHVAFV